MYTAFLHDVRFPDGRWLVFVSIEDDERTAVEFPVSIQDNLAR